MHRDWRKPASPANKYSLTNEFWVHSICALTTLGIPVLTLLHLLQHLMTNIRVTAQVWGFFGKDWAAYQILPPAFKVYLFHLSVSQQRSQNEQTSVRSLTQLERDMSCQTQELSIKNSVGWSIIPYTKRLWGLILCQEVTNLDFKFDPPIGHI